MTRGRSRVDAATRVRLGAFQRPGYGACEKEADNV